MAIDTDELACRRGQCSEPESPGSFRNLSRNLSDTSRNVSDRLRPTQRCSVRGHVQHKSPAFAGLSLTRQTGLEPVTFGFVGRVCRGFA
jgi:hypothetical protein